ncbi:FAD-binding type PCMH-like superfamily [Arabidopsis suecica]|uniref:FAD-binding type PCMH-like superfamily n=1 Tax=Arabidopsis suecica TaxID=45249 RepID=A0A8T2C8H3_ARASU|nr:FAD-binding type PCMH-like superfamily [Arabidopsis suecica]
MKLSCFVFLILSSLVSSSLATAPPNASIYESFLQCFSNHTGAPPEKLCDVVLPQSSASFTPTLRAYIRNARFNTSTSPKPLLVIAARSECHVQATVLCTKSLNFQLKTRSGGHDYDGVSYISNRPFFVLDMSYLRNITVDMSDDGGSAWVGAGATLGEVYYNIWQSSKTHGTHGFPAGVCPTVGAGGHISGGGYGNMIRKYGLSVDYVTDAKIVDVNGRILDRKSMGEDLFWAIGGGGGASFGVILSFKIKLVPVPPRVTVFRVEKTLEENALDMVHKWQFVAPKTSPDLFMRLMLQPVTRNTTQTVRASVVALFLGKQSDLMSLLAKEFPELGLKQENCTEMTWIQSVMWWANNDNAMVIKPEILLDRNPDSASFLKRKSDYVETEISKDGLDFLFKKLMEAGKLGLVFNPYGGKMSEVATTATPFPHRKRLFKVQHSMNWKDPGTEAESSFMEKTRSFYSYMAPFVTKNPRHTYLNYRDLDIGINSHGPNSYREAEVYGRKYFGENFDRLVKVKTAVDPENFFRDEQSIPTLPTKPASS